MRPADVVRPATRAMRAAGGLALLAASAACAAPPRTALAPVTDVALAVDRWLTCYECFDGELEDVVRAGDAAVPRLASALRGLTPARRTGLQASLSTKWRRTAAWVVERGRSPAISEAEYVGLHVDNYVAFTQERAAVALGAIGSADSRDALMEADAAARDGSIVFRDSVLRTVRTLLAASGPVR